jgi:hypothetical protein
MAEIQTPSAAEEEEVRGKTRRRRKRGSSNTRMGDHGTSHDVDDYSICNETKEDKDDFVASMILSTLDTESYEEAAWEDADRIMKNHILPKCLPWSKPRVPLLRSIPRDIEDMLGVLHAGDDEEGDSYRKDFNSGRLGYGMFDMGGLCKEDVKGTVAESVVTKPTTNNATGEKATPMKSSSNENDTNNHVDDQNYNVENEDSLNVSSNNPTFVAAARRSDCPGVIELTGKITHQCTEVLFNAGAQMF